MEPLSNQNCHPYNDGHLYVDLRHELVMLDRQVVPLTHKEYCLLLLLVQHAGEVVTRNTRDAGLGARAWVAITYIGDPHPPVTEKTRDIRKAAN